MNEQLLRYAAKVRMIEPSPILRPEQAIREAAPIPKEDSPGANVNGAGLPRLAVSYRISASGVARRWSVLGSHTHATEIDHRTVLKEGSLEEMRIYGCNIENFIGTVTVPIGLVGPLKIQGTYAKGEFFLPLATTEAALVASYHRGIGLITEAGGCSAAVLDEKLGRAPLIEFQTVRDVTRFLAWAAASFEDLRSVAQSTTRHGRLIGMNPVVNGNQIFLLLEYTTGDAAGQNMTTIATEAICRFISEKYPVKPQRITIDSGYSGDKKATARSFTTVRGKRVSADVVIDRQLLQRHLRTTPAQMVACWQGGAIGCVMSGAIGIQAHYANGLAALFLATGQDVACIAEAAVGITRFQETDDGNLYASVTLPNLVMGSVGGGTSLPAQAACLRIANSFGADGAGKLAELCAALCLAGEISLIAAFAAGNFAQAHQRLARKRARANVRFRPSTGHCS